MQGVNDLYKTRPTDSGAIRIPSHHCHAGIDGVPSYVYSRGCHPFGNRSLLERQDDRNRTQTCRSSFHFSSHVPIMASYKHPVSQPAPHAFVTIHTGGNEVAIFNYNSTVELGRQKPKFAVLVYFAQKHPARSSFSP